MAATSNKSSLHPVATKVVLVVIAVAMIGFLFSSATDAAGEEASAAPQQEKQQPQCNLWVPDCDAWCRLEGHPAGGYVKGDVCCCNSGGQQLASDS